MAPSSSPHKLFPSHQTEVPRHQATKPTKKYRSIADIMARTEPVVINDSDYINNITCDQCGSGERPDELLLCDKCSRGYHMTCVRPVVVRIPIRYWFCPDCSVHPPVEYFSQKKLVEFFRIQRGKKVERRRTNSYSVASHVVRRRQRRSIFVPQKKKRRFLPYVPSEDQERRLVQMQSLAIALTSHGMDFCNKLTYHRRMAPRSANRAELEIGGMQILSREDTKTVERCLTMVENGEFPPLLVVYDSILGFTVEADDNIKDMTFLLEYTGDVDYIQNHERDECDSLMTLFLAHDSSKSLVICPDKRGNIGRFVSGINNYTPDGKKRLNVKSVRYNVDGECRVFFIATRDITKGERLYLDYNGYEKEYPTEHFI